MPEHLEWRKSSYSGAHGGNCVEVAASPRGVRVRDTRDRELGHLSFPSSDWRSFVGALKAGESLR